nr:HAD family hydrolase [Nocardiopsis baichengensis]
MFTDVLSDAGLDPDLSEALYEVESDPLNELVADDAPDFLARTRASGVRIAVVSDVHVDGYALSYEHGAEKPDLRLFEAALSMVGACPGEALMVGDRYTHDGGATALRMAALILPPLTARTERRLHLAERLLAPP